MERNGQVGPHGRVGWFAAGEVDGGGRIDGHDRTGSKGVDQADEAVFVSDENRRG